MKYQLIALLGFFSMAAVIGVLTGISSTPVVAVVIPLVFSIVTAGAAVKTGRSVAANEAKVLAHTGGQLLAFAIGFSGGLYLGVGAKLHVRAIWNLPASVVDATMWRDGSELPNALRLDRQMIEAGIAASERDSMLRKLLRVESARAKADSTARALVLTAIATAGPNDTLAARVLADQMATVLAGGPAFRLGSSGRGLLANFITRDSLFRAEVLSVLSDPTLQWIAQNPEDFDGSQAIPVFPNWDRIIGPNAVAEDIRTDPFSETF